VTAILLIFGAPMLIAGAMIDPQGLHLWGLITYAGIMLVVMPFAGWPLLATQFVLPTAGRSRTGAVASLWFGGTLTAVAVTFWICAVLDYPRPDARIDPMGHWLIPFAPKTGVAGGLFCLCMLVSCGVWGAISPILRQEVAIKGALISGCVLFAVVYVGGYLLVAS
jgi:hypothetical protein